MHHHNKHIRYYIDNAAYFITTVTDRRFPWFEDDILCGLFIDDLELCAAIKNFIILGYKINPDHIHLLIQPQDKHDFSEVMRSLKTNFSRNANHVIASCTSKEGHIQQQRLTGPHYRLHKYIDMFKENHKKMNPYPPFRWQSSFHDHVIRDKRDLDIHLRYLQFQCVKHGLRENKWLWIAPHVGRVT